MNKEIQETIRRTSSAKGDGTRYGHQLGRCCDFHHEAEDLYVDKNKTRNHPWLCTRRSHLISIADLKKKKKRKHHIYVRYHAPYIALEYSPPPDVL